MWIRPIDHDHFAAIAKGLDQEPPKGAALPTRDMIFPDLAVMNNVSVTAPLICGPLPVLMWFVGTNKHFNLQHLLIDQRP
jgi:hypothetical protein